MSLSKSALNLIAYSEGLKLKGVLGRLVMRPDSVKKTIDNMVEGSDDVMRLILNDNKMLALFNAAVPEMFGRRSKRYNASSKPSCAGVLSRVRTKRQRLCSLG
jgi:hypothetical protein